MAGDETSGIATAIEYIFVGVCLCFLAYGLFRAAAAGWYKGKLEYQRKLLDEVSPDGADNG